MADQRPAAGWKRDPSGRHFGRYWDGERWTDQVVSAEKVQGVDPIAPPAPAQRPAQPTVARSGPTPTAPGWTPEVSATDPADERRQGAYLLLGGAGAIAVGCFLPWASITAPFVGTISKAGIEGDGVFFLGLAAALAGIAFAFARTVPSSLPQRRWGLAVLIAVLALFTAFEVTDLTSRFADLSDEEFTVATSYGAGLWLVGAGVIAAAIGWFRMPWGQMKPGRDDAPAPSPEAEDGGTV